MDDCDIVDTETPTKERTVLYTMLVQFYIYSEKLSVDEAHKMVDRIYKWLRENES